jgi:hypothetical protein
MPGTARKFLAGAGEIRKTSSKLAVQQTSLKTLVLS